MGPRRPSRSASALVAVSIVGLFLLPTPFGSASAVSPLLPVGDGAGFVVGLSAPILAPGGSGTVSGAWGDPIPNQAISDVDLTVGVYGLNGYPGNDTSLATAGELTLAGGGSPGSEANLSIAAVAPGASIPWAFSVDASTSAPSGTYQLRLRETFVENGTVFTLESRGYFDAATWASSTTGPGGNSTLNLTKLGVSGVIPETAVLVRSNPYPTVLYVLLGVSGVLAAAGGYYAFRRGPGSSSGASSPAPPHRAPSAFGKRRTSDGERARS